MPNSVLANFQTWALKLELIQFTFTSSPFLDRVPESIISRIHLAEETFQSVVNKIALTILSSLLGFTEWAQWPRHWTLTTQVFSSLEKGYINWHLALKTNCPSFCWLKNDRKTQVSRSFPSPTPQPHLPKALTSIPTHSCLQASKMLTWSSGSVAIQ